MDKREVPHIQKVLDYAWALSLEEIGACTHFSKRSVIPLGKIQHLSLGCAEAHPNQTISFLDVIHRDPGTRWRRM